MPATDTGLKSAPAVMAWRRVSALGHADDFAGKVASLPKVGNNKYATIYDGGNALVGYWVQQKLAEVVAKEHNVTPERLADLRAQLANCCGKNFDPLALVSNPANQLLVGSGDFQGAVTRLGRTFKVAPAVTKSASGDIVSFVDQDGNFSGVVRPGGAGVPARVGTKLRKLLSQNVTNGKRGARSAKKRGRLVGYELLVSNLKASQKFYATTLGLRSLGGSRTHAQFDLGTMVLTIRLEPALGLVRSLQRGNRLEGDWLVFHVDDIEEKFSQLKRRGVKFPLGIEDSSHGRGALFQDPDGHVLNIWEPPASLGNPAHEHKVLSRAARGGRRLKKADQDINFFPQLNRILQQNQ